MEDHSNSSDHDSEGNCLQCMYYGYLCDAHECPSCSDKIPCPEHQCAFQGCKKAFDLRSEQRYCGLHSCQFFGCKTKADLVRRCEGKSCQMCKGYGCQNRLADPRCHCHSYWDAVDDGW